MFIQTSPNSGHVVRYRSPKPLQALHTRKTLSAHCGLEKKRERKERHSNQIFIFHLRAYECYT